MIIDYSYSTLQQFPAYLGLGNVWTFNGTVDAAVVVETITDIGLEWTLPANLMHHTLPTNVMHWTEPDNLMHWTLKKDDIE